MPSIAGKYQHYKNEDVEDYFVAVGVPYIGRKMMSMSSPVMEISIDGDKMTIKNSSLIRTVEWTFIIGEEYDEAMPNTTIKSVTKVLNDHEMVTTSVIPETGVKCGRHYEFTDEGCIIANERIGPLMESGHCCPWTAKSYDFSSRNLKISNALPNLKPKMECLYANNFTGYLTPFEHNSANTAIWRQTLTHENATKPGKRYFKRIN